MRNMRNFAPYENFLLYGKLCARAPVGCLSNWTCYNLIGTFELEKLQNQA